MRPFKVAVDIRDLRIAKTGVKTYTEELIKEFKKYPSDNIQFVYLDTFLSVYTGRNKLLKLIEHVRFLLWKQVILPVRARLNKCDVIFCADFFVPYFALGAKTVPVLHDAFFFEYPQHYNKIWLWLFHSLGITAAKKAAVIVTPTLYTRQRIAQLAGIPSEKIVAIYEGPKTLSYISANQKFPKALVNQKYLLHVGVLEKRKNLVNLLKAYVLLVKEYPEIKLVLAGSASPKKDMDDYNVITAFIKNNDLQDNVILTGYLPDAELAAYYQHALMYVFPSLNEGFGIPVLEAFKQGLPVLIANNSCLPEVAADAAITFDPHNPNDIYSKIKLLIEDGYLRMEMIRKGKERVRLFTWQHTASQLVAVFESVIEKKA